MVGDDTLLGQLAADTITSQLIDLAETAWRTAWQHETRGPHGEWERGAALLTPEAVSARHAPPAAPAPGKQFMRPSAQSIQAARTAKLDRAASAVVDHMSPANKAEMVSMRAQSRISARIAGAPVPKMADLLKTPPEKFGPVQAHQLVEAQYTQELHPAHSFESHLPDVVQKADDRIEKALNRFREEEHSASSEEARKAARKKMIIEGSVAIAGATLAAVIGIFGAPLAAIIAATFGPILIQVGLEHHWELAWPTAM